MLVYTLFFFNDTATTEIYTLSLHDALPISHMRSVGPWRRSTTASAGRQWAAISAARSEEHTSELQSLAYLVCRLLLEKKKSTGCGLQRLPEPAHFRAAAREWCRSPRISSAH